ncbi:histone H3-like centromeric protein A [Gracilaria domingensis]|nr:histone H3-like centromeric protein A [Gracilaria domingensis]
MDRVDGEANRRRSRQKSLPRRMEAARSGGPAATGSSAPAPTGSSAPAPTRSSAPAATGSSAPAATGSSLPGPSPLEVQRVRRRGTRAIMEIRKYQRSVNLLIKPLPFSRLVKEITQKYHHALRRWTMFTANTVRPSCYRL